MFVEIEDNTIKRIILKFIQNHGKPLNCHAVKL